MAEDHDVSRIGEVWGRMAHRTLQIERCENGYVVKYKKPSEKPTEYSQTVEARRVFITNADMLEFVERYFEGEPKP